MMSLSYRDVFVLIIHNASLSQQSLNVFMQNFHQHFL